MCNFFFNLRKKDFMQCHPFLCFVQFYFKTGSIIYSKLKMLYSHKIGKKQTNQ